MWYWQLRAEVAAEVQRTRRDETSVREAATAAAAAAVNSERRADLAARSARRTQRTQEWQLPVPTLVPALLPREVEQLERHHHERELSARHVHVRLLLLSTCCMLRCSRSPRRRETRLALPRVSCSSASSTVRWCARGRAAGEAGFVEPVTIAPKGGPLACSQASETNETSLSWHIPHYRLFSSLAAPPT